MYILDYNCSENPLYVQIYQCIKNDIKNGNLLEKTKLPSKRQFAQMLDVSINTIDTAFAQLQSEGYVEIRPKSGVYVTKIDSLLHIEMDNNVNDTCETPLDFTVDFSTAKVDLENFPHKIWRKFLKDSFDEMEKDLLNAPPTGGILPLKESICKYLWHSRGIKCHTSQIIIGTGTSSILRCICGILGKNSVFATENPVYSKAYEIFNAMSKQCLFVDTTKEDKILSNLQKNDIDVFYVTPSHNFPLGHSIPIKTRMSLLNWAGMRDGRYIIEDDYDSEFRYFGKPLPPIKSLDKYEKVIYVGTFSKLIAPSLKISYGVLPLDILQKFLNIGEIYMSNGSKLEQQVLCKFMESGDFEKHINRMRNIYKRKREKLVGILSKNSSLTISGENAGHHIVVKHKTLSQTALEQKAKEVGIKVYPLSQYFLSEIGEEYQNSVLLGYAALDMDSIEKGATTLLQIWK